MNKKSVILLAAFCLLANGFVYADDRANHELLCFAARGDVEQVKRLLARGADINTQDNVKFTPLLYAVANDYPEVVKVLLEEGADPFLEDCVGRNSFDYARSLERPNQMRMKRILALKGLEGKLECPICLDEKQKKEIAVLPCGHYICKACLPRLGRLTCPICREPFRQEDVIP